jgi:hypothetical protein
MRTLKPYFGTSHPLAEVAERHCQDHRAELIGDVACGACWELAIRDDERVVVEYGLPREVEPDPDYIDEIAVELACGGERVSLTRAERVEAVRRLHAKRFTTWQIMARLRISYTTFCALTDNEPVGSAA